MPRSLSPSRGGRPAAASNAPAGSARCDYVQHLGMFDGIAVSTMLGDHVVEWADHPHEHFRDPAAVVAGRQLTPTTPGHGVEILEASFDRFELLACSACSQPDSTAEQIGGGGGHREGRQPDPSLG